jgi:iron complex transport system permease protein
MNGMTKTKNTYSELAENGQADYGRFIGKKMATMCALAILLVGLMVYAVNVGAFRLSISEILRALFSREEPTMHHVLWNIRLPRIVAAVLSGAGLGVAGVIMQNLLKNPLASPFTAGVSQGAAFGAAFAIIILGAGATHLVGNEGVTVFLPHVIATSAFIGSLLTVFFILTVSAMRNVSTEAVILAGVAIGAFFTAATMLLQYFATDVQVATTLFWAFGDIGKAGWKENTAICIIVFLSLIYFIWNSWNYNAHLWGEDVAESLGVKVKSLRIIGMLLSCMIVSVITAFLGIIGFIGLIAPHLMRFFVGDDYRFLVPCSALSGALLLLLSDILGRTILEPAVIPVGIITSFMGAPMFFYLLIRHRKI